MVRLSNKTVNERLEDFEDVYKFIDKFWKTRFASSETYDILCPEEEEKMKIATLLAIFCGSIFAGESADGRAFIKSDPVGATIILVANGEKKDTGKVTPALIQLPIGKQSLELTLKGRKTATLAVEVDGKAIAKPETATLDPLTIPIDILFEDGWQVFVDGKSTKAVGTGKPETPCTIELQFGVHEIGLGKDGFLDIKQRVDVIEGGIKTGETVQAQIEIKTKPSKGTSMLTRSAPAVVANKTEVIFEESMGYVVSDLVPGVYAHKNSQVQPVGDIPNELQGKKYTQVVCFVPGGVKIKFKTAGKLWIVSEWPAAMTLIEKHGKKQTYKVFNWSVFCVTGTAGQVISIPYQVILIGDSLTKVNKID